MSDLDSELEINPKEINETESRQITLLLTLLKYPEGLKLEEIRSKMTFYYNNSNINSDQKKINRDIEELNELGFAAKYSPSLKKYQLNNDSAESRIKFTESELGDISQSLIHSDFSSDFSPDVYSLAQKIFGSNWNLYPYFPDSKELAEPLEPNNQILETIIHSIKSKFAIFILYMSNYGKPIEKEIDPIQIIRKNSIDLYLYAFDRIKEDYRTYLIPCIIQCSRMDTDQVKLHNPPKDWNPTNPLRFKVTDEKKIIIGINENRLNNLLSFLKDCPYNVIDSEVHLTTTNMEALYPIVLILNQYINRIQPLEFQDGYKNFVIQIQNMHSCL